MKINFHNEKDLKFLLKDNLFVNRSDTILIKKFYRIHSNENETTSGTGLGLTVTKDIVEEQHGKLLVESTLGKGSKFTIVLKSA